MEEQRTLTYSGIAPARRASEAVKHRRDVMDVVGLYRHQLLVFLALGARCRLYRDGPLRIGQLAYSGAYNLHSSPHARTDVRPMRGNAVGRNAVTTLYKGPRLEIEPGTSQTCIRVPSNATFKLVAGGVRCR